MSDILVIGSSNIDLVMQVERIPRPGETITEGKFTQIFGGKGANQAIAARRAGGKVRFMTCVGADAFGDQMKQNFKDEGMDTELFLTTDKESSGTAMIFVDQKGENSIGVAPGANFELAPQHIDRSIRALEEAEYILLQYEIRKDTLEYIIEKGNALKKQVVLNLAPARELSQSHLTGVDILIVNELEAEFLTGHPIKKEKDIEQAGRKLLALGLDNAVMTLGSKGSYHISREQQEMISAFKVDPVDTTAAGDVFSGALVASLASGQLLPQAIRFANVAAAISVTRLGAQPSAPVKGEIEEFLEREE